MVGRTALPTLCNFAKQQAKERRFDNNKRYNTYEDNQPDGINAVVNGGSFRLFHCATLGARQSGKATNGFRPASVAKRITGA
jgi:hypothetical protein